MEKMKANMNHPSSQSPPKQATNGYYPNNNNSNFNAGNGGYNNNNGNGYNNNKNGNGFNGGLEATKSINNGYAVPKFNNAPISGQQSHTQNYLPSSVQPNTGSYVPSLLEFKN
jgi:hypothetical protein